jgi:hypothetical protein
MAYVSRAILTPTTPTAPIPGRLYQACYSQSTVVPSSGHPRVREQSRTRALRPSTQLLTPAPAYFVWLDQLSDDLRVPLVKRSTTLAIDDKPAATYHNGVVITDDRPDVALDVDNKGAIDMAHAHGPTKRTKHLDVGHHYLQQCVARKVLRMRQCTTDAQLADCLAKALGRVKFLQAFQLLQHRD